MIKISKTGMCRRCTRASFELGYIEQNGQKTWIIKCIHEDVCEARVRRLGVMGWY